MSADAGIVSGARPPPDINRLRRHATCLAASTPTPLSLALLAALAPLSEAVKAADSSITLNPVVITGSRAEAASFDLPAAITCWTRADHRWPTANAFRSPPGRARRGRQQPPDHAQGPADLEPVALCPFGLRVRGVKLITDGIPASMPDGQARPPPSTWM